MKHIEIWRMPDAETSEYPGLVVQDGRVSGSITVGHSRLPVWAFIGATIRAGWQEAESYDPGQYGMDADKMAHFIYDLMELRGEFGRLLLVLADAERCDRVRGAFTKPWWRTKRHRNRVATQLKRCLATLEDE